jgi:hypothetical protein
MLENLKLMWLNDLLSNGTGGRTYEAPISSRSRGTGSPATLESRGSLKRPGSHIPPVVQSHAARLRQTDIIDAHGLHRAGGSGSTTVSGSAQAVPRAGRGCVTSPLDILPKA